MNIYPPVCKVTIASLCKFIITKKVSVFWSHHFDAAPALDQGRKNYAAPTSTPVYCLMKCTDIIVKLIKDLFCGRASARVCGSCRLQNSIKNGQFFQKYLWEAFLTWNPLGVSTRTLPSPPCAWPILNTQGNFPLCSCKQLPCYYSIQCNVPWVDGFNLFCWKDLYGR
jgi:hypothetical protein